MEKHLSLSYKISHLSKLGPKTATLVSNDLEILVFRREKLLLGSSDFPLTILGFSVTEITGKEGNVSAGWGY